MKRFTETDIWDKEWFMGLDASCKLAWLYIKDRCDCAGFWDINMRLLRFQIGFDVILEDLERAFEGRIMVLDNGRLWIRKFIEFQQGTTELNESNKAHLGIIRRLEKNGINYEKERTYQAPLKDLPRVPSIGIGISKGKEGVSKGEYNKSFLEFWKEYPKKKGKGAAFLSWKRQGCAKIKDEIIKSIEDHMPEWRAKGMQYVPHPSTYLNQRRWEDEIGTELNLSEPVAPKKQSIWEMETKLKHINERIEQLRSKSPGSHCDLRDFLKKEEQDEYAELWESRQKLESKIRKAG